MAKSDPVDLGAVLEQSRAAHVEYRRNTPHMRSIGGRLVQVAGDPVKARAALERAGELRKQAHDADPDQTDDAWLKDETISGVESHKLLTFQGEQVAKPAPAEVAREKRAEAAAAEKGSK